MFDLGVGPCRAGPQAVPLCGAGHDQLPQPARLGVAVGDLERRQLRRDERQFERALLPQFGRRGDGMRVLGEQPAHLRTRTQVRGPLRGQPAGRGVQGVAGPDRRHGRRQPGPARLGDVCGGGGDHPHPEPHCQSSQLGVAFVIDGMAVVGQFDTDPAAPETIHQIGQRLGRRLRSAA